MLSSVIKVFEKAIDIYNRFRCPEACASIAMVIGDRVWVRFKGHFCLTCGVYDWLEDLRYILEDLGVYSEIERVLEPEEDGLNELVAIFRVVGVAMDGAGH